MLTRMWRFCGSALLLLTAAPLLCLSMIGSIGSLFVAGLAIRLSLLIQRIFGRRYF